jgi:hypothetical protein
MRRVSPGAPALDAVRTQPISNERSDGLLRGVPPADAERVTGRVGVHLMAFQGVKVARLEQFGAKPDRHLVCGSRIFNLKVDMYLLRSTIRPLGWNVVRR